MWFAGNPFFLIPKTILNKIGISKRRHAVVENTIVASEKPEHVRYALTNMLHGVCRSN